MCFNTGHKPQMRKANRKRTHRESGRLRARPESESAMMDRRGSDEPGLSPQYLRTEAPVTKGGNVLAFRREAADQAAIKVAPQIYYLSLRSF